jgi:hypothetical protein
MKKAKKEPEATTAVKYTENQEKFNTQFTNAVLHKKGSCFWGIGFGGTSNGASVSGGINGSNWDDRISLQDKFAIMWWGNLPQDQGYRSNIKSPEIAGRLQSTMQKLSKVNLEWVAYPNNPDLDDMNFMAQVIQLIVNIVYENSGFKYRLKEIFYDALRHGTAPATLDFLVRTRKVKLYKPEDTYTEKELKKFKENKQPILLDATILDKRDIVLTNQRFQDIVIDPTCRNIHGDVYYAGYYYKTSMIPYDRWKDIAKTRTGWDQTQVDLVKPWGQLADAAKTDTTWMQPPKNIQEDYVWEVEMRNYDKDLLIIRANDKFVYEAPLPNNDKKLNLFFFTPFKLPEYPYGIGLVDFLIPIVTAIEVITNNIADYAAYSSNPILMVAKNDYASFSKYYRKAQAGLMIPVSDIQRAVAPLKYLPLSMDVFQVLQALQRDAIIASQQDPSQLGVVQKNATATANIINKEITDAYVNFVLDNFIENLDLMGNQVLSLIHQFLTQKDVTQILNGKGEIEDVETERALMTEGRKIDIDWDGKKINIVETPGESHPLMVSDIFKKAKAKNKKGQEIVVSPNDFNVRLASESVEVLSKSLKMQKSKENFAALAQYMVDPADRAKTAEHPMPLINAVSFMEEFFETQGINKKHLLHRDIMLKQDIELAKEHNKEIFKLERPVPEAGMSDTHLRIQEEFLKSLEMQLEQKKKVMESHMQSQVEQIMPDVNGQIPENAPQIQPPDPKLISAIDRLQQVVDMLSEHIEIESMPAYDRTDSIIKGTQGSTVSPQAGGQGGNTMFGGVGNMGQGNTAMPNLPQQGGMPTPGMGNLGGLSNQIQQ